MSMPLPPQSATTINMPARLLEELRITKSQTPQSVVFDAWIKRTVLPAS